jgi:hypothetical protein
MLPAVPPPGNGMSKRIGISTRKRFEVFKRDGFTCLYCGAHPPSVILHCDHIVPVAEGGGNEMDNLTTACERCNLGKSSVPLTVVPMSLAEKAAIVKEREAQLKAYTKILRAAKDRIIEDSWEVATPFCEAYRKESIRKDWFASINRFVELLGVMEVIDAMSVALSRKSHRGQQECFVYFCGICWRKVRGGND